MAKAKILLLEDDANLNETVTDFLEDEGYIVDSTYDGHEAQDKLYETKYDLLLLDVNTPGIDGFTLLKEARKNGVVSPSIFITSLNGVDDLERGFQSGCDDYIRKPFVIKELLIRIETLLRRGFFHEATNMIFIAENIEYNTKSNELIVDGYAETLGNKESALFKLFMKHPNEVLSHDRIYKELWDYDEDPSDTALRTYIKNIRKIIGKDRIVSIKKQGYKFTS
ncbi:MAG: chemotaxis protein CheY [Sulfurovum sp. FS06-10]|jgi:DNA-binding response OmpR family regulator|nr:MAG: chemotaxis protein CheY [Sulfurovum sp. FS06-10]